MRAVHILSLIARVAFMVTMVVGLLFWIAQISFIGMFLHHVLSMGFVRGIHMALGITGTLFFLVLSLIAISTRGIRLLGGGSILYTLILPTFGLTQTMFLVGNVHWLIQATHLLVGIGAMFLVLKIEKRYKYLKQSGITTIPSRETAFQTMQ